MSITQAEIVGSSLGKEERIKAVGQPFVSSYFEKKNKSRHPRISPVYGYTVWNISLT